MVIIKQWHHISDTTSKVAGRKGFVLFIDGNCHDHVEKSEGLIDEYVIKLNGDFFFRPVQLHRREVIWTSASDKLWADPTDSTRPDQHVLGEGSLASLDPADKARPGCCSGAEQRAEPSTASVRPRHHRSLDDQEPIFRKPILPLLC
jgi:hypothetical protein